MAASSSALQLRLPGVGVQQLLLLLLPPGRTGGVLLQLLR
jgi:hypothetical protein